MAVTLAQAKLKTQDKLSMAVIDEFRKSSFLMDHMISMTVFLPWETERQ